VRQQNSGVVEDFILPYSTVYLRMQKWKNYWNRSTFAKVMVKSGSFYDPRCSLLLCCILPRSIIKGLVFSDYSAMRIFWHIKSWNIRLF